MLRSSALAICALLCGISALDAQDQFLGKSTVEWASLLKDKDAKVRRNAAFALGKAGRRVGPQIADLRNAFAAEKDPKVKDTIVYSLAQICGEVKDFFTLYTSPNVRDLDNATKLANAYPEICLGKDGGSSDLENIFLNAVADNDPYLRRSGALGLSSLAKKSDATRAALEKALSDQHAMVRQNAAIGLWQFGGDGVPMFRKALRDEDSLVKRDAAAALRRVSDGEKVAELKTELLQLCRDNNSEVRRAALNVLVRVLNNKDKDAIAPLQEAMQDKDIENRRNAAIAMSNIGGDKAVPALPVLLEAAKDRDADPQVRRQTVLAIRNIGKEAVGAMPELIRLLRDDDDEEVRKHAALAIGGIGAEAAKSGATFVQHIEPAVPILVEKIQNANERPEVRRECAMCLARIGRVPAADGIAPKLLAVLGDPDHDATVRERVMWALRVHEDNLTSFAGAKETFSKIMKEPRNQQNKMLRYDCAYMLGMIWKADAPDHALDLLLEFLHDKEIKIYRGTDTIAGSGGVEIVGAKGKVTDVGFGDGRTMATDALANIGPTRYGQRQDIMKQLQVIVDTTQDKVLKEKAENRIKAVR